MPEPAAVVVLISGQGRNLQALIDGIAAGRVPARIAAVISNRADAPGLARAQRAGIATAVLSHRDYASREAYDAALAAAIDAHAPDLVLLAGFMRILTPGFTQAYAGRLINIHPSLLPRHPGLDTHRRALEAGDVEHGATVHFVTEALDGGPPIIQGGFTVLPQDDAQSLAVRVMEQVEQRIYPQAVAWLARRELLLDGDGVRFRGLRLPAPLGLGDLEEGF
ncbi:MAG TPA: phosphoribosylglycinamide formyltransferase [Solimonas sp.]